MELVTRHQAEPLLGYAPGSLKAVLSQARREAIREDPELVERMRAAALPAEELARRSADARVGTDAFPSVRQARRRGWDRSVAKS